MRLLISAIIVILGLGCFSLGREGQAARDVEDRLSKLEQKLERLLALLVAAGIDFPGETAPAQAAPVVESETGPRDSTAPGVQTSAAGSPQGDAPAPPSTQINGYMEIHLNKDGINPATLDFHRFVLLFGHQFGSRIQFVSEIELEHALVEGGEFSGEIELEQAYLNFRLDPRLNFRAGMMLTPIGIINQTHEPPSFNGVERPFVDTVILPTTWFAGGAGIVGDLGSGVSYKLLVMSPLNGSMFSAAEGFRDGRQKGFFENARNMATVARLDYRGLPGLTAGGGIRVGETGFDFRDLSAQLKILEFDATYRLGRFDTRGQFVWSDLQDAGRINRLLQQQTGVNPNVAEQMRGFYWEGAYHLLPQLFLHDLVGFYRYENFDTQFRMPAGFLPLNQFDRSAHVVGLTYSPYPDVAFKLDYTLLNSASTVVRVPDQWNFGLGWWF